MGEVYHKDLSGEDLHPPKAHGNEAHTEVFLTEVPEHGTEKHYNVRRKIFLPASEGLLFGHAELIDYDWKGVVAKFPHGYDSWMFHTFMIPSDVGDPFKSPKIYFVYIGCGTPAGNVVWSASLRLGGAGGTWDRHTSQDAVNLLHVHDRNIYNIETTLDFDYTLKGDYVGLELVRDGDSSDDTYTGNFLVLGWMIEYEAEQ